MRDIVLKPSEDVNTGFRVSKMEPIYINLVSHLWFISGSESLQNFGQISQLVPEIVRHWHISRVK